jgi:hypothetical protein
MSFPMEAHLSEQGNLVFYNETEFVCVFVGAACPSTRVQSHVCHKHVLSYHRSAPFGHTTDAALVPGTSCTGTRLPHGFRVCYVFGPG